tara:strand:+ start:211 stop:867 length:657 start_codon:yes stop_codon:yes gene_type:complete
MNDILNLKPLIILGSGTHAKVLYNILKKSGREILGVTDPKGKVSKNLYDLNVIGTDEIIFKYSFHEVELVNGVAGLNNINNRQQLTKKFVSEGYKFSKVIHPSVIISDNVKLDEGVQIMAGAILQNNVRVGSSSIINTGAIIDHDCIIYKNCHIGPGVVLNGNVVIGESSHIGTGTSVIENKKIGPNSIIAAGSVIYKNIPKNKKLIQLRQEKMESLE